MSRKNRLPSVSIIIPTLNAERVLKQCMASLCEQEYPEELLEILVVDGGSEDHTLSIVNHFSKHRAFPIRVLQNPLKTGEAGKARGAKQAVHDILAFIDSDNVLPGKRWLKEMIAPFDDAGIVAAEPLYFTYRKEDTYIDRYCSLMGMNDPLCFFLGNYDRVNQLTGKWTAASVQVTDAGGYLQVLVCGKMIPTIGANGFLIRKKALLDLPIGDYLFDVDVLGMLIEQRRKVVIGKVKCGIVHLYCADFKTFVRKQRRRVVDYYRHGGVDRPRMRWNVQKTTGVVLFLIYCISVVPLFWQSFVGYRKRPDRCWLFHPLACWTTLLVYGYASAEKLWGRKTQLSRAGWSQ